MKEITSISNNLVKETCKLQQKKYRGEYILIEGKKPLDEAIEANLEIKYIFSKDIKGYENFETYLVTDAILEKVSTTESAPSVVAVVKRPVYKLNLFKNFKKIVLLDDIKDPGNLGTIIRAASAFGVDGILLFKDTVDEFSPKTIRSSAGNMFKIPVLKVGFKDLAEFKKTHKFIATVCRSDKTLAESAICPPLIIMFGSEANGLCNELLTLADEKVTLKMTNGVESLNLAVSAGIFLYELQKL